MIDPEMVYPEVYDVPQYGYEVDPRHIQLEVPLPPLPKEFYEHEDGNWLHASESCESLMDVSGEDGWVPNMSRSSSSDMSLADSFGGSLGSPDELVFFDYFPNVEFGSECNLSDLQNATSKRRPVKRRESAAQCNNCGTTTTPSWRRNILGELLCNACGLYYKVHNQPRPLPNSMDEEEIILDPGDARLQCKNCMTVSTPMWRRNDLNETVCNACGLYYKLHHHARPIELKHRGMTKVRPTCRRRSRLPSM